MDSKTKIKTLIQTLKPNTLVVASKYADSTHLTPLKDISGLILGENRVQDAEAKQKLLGPTAITWHMIGHLQKNKIRKAVTYFDRISSIDRLSLAEKLNTICEELGKRMPILIQVNIADDPKKYGFSKDICLDAVKTIKNLSNLSIQGIMVVIPFEEEVEKTRPFFRQAKILFDALKKTDPSLTVLSMGTSRDYKIALEEGATEVRVGRTLFLEHA